MLCFCCATDLLQKKLWWYLAFHEVFLVPCAGLLKWVCLCRESFYWIIIVHIPRSPWAPCAECRWVLTTRCITSFICLLLVHSTYADHRCTIKLRHLLCGLPCKFVPFMMMIPNSMCFTSRMSEVFTWMLLTRFINSLKVHHFHSTFSVLHQYNTLRIPYDSRCIFSTVLCLPTYNTSEIGVLCYIVAILLLFCVLLVCWPSVFLQNLQKLVLISSIESPTTGNRGIQLFLFFKI